jgi:exodeoxyribonuclease-3
LQELKGEEFPFAEFQNMGYDAIVKSQKAYNGVAILFRTEMKTKIKLVRNTLPGQEQDGQARFLEINTGTLRLINIYAPNGNPMGTEKFIYKIQWLSNLYRTIQELRQKRIDFVLIGDFNIIPEDIDCYDPAAWAHDALFQPEVRKIYRQFLNLGCVDCFRALYPHHQEYTFWDYQAGAWPRNQGLRIDHILLSPRLADQLLGAQIDRIPRGLEKASDHTPIFIEF